MRTLVTVQAWARNPILSTPRLDAEYYLAWAGDIASGDVAGRSGIVGGGPFLLNPLYAYVIAPLVGAFGATPVPVLVMQALLAAATTALAAAAAKRWAGSTAAWVAGLAVAFSTALTHLDGYVAVSGLAAFLVAGACFACSPSANGKEQGHGPVAAGVWLGLSALARPVVLFALPFVAWLFARRDERRARAATLVLLPFALFAAVSFARNVAVSGESVVYTAANGQNLYIGNNTAARRMRAMFTDEFRFAPREMHEDAKFRVAVDLSREPTRSEVSSWYAARAVNELTQHPAASLGWYLQKLRWFFSPEEPASSADLEFDRGLTPMLRLAFVPTWVLAAFCVAAAIVCRNRRDLLLGPGALVLAHLVACTLSFPLSHYRSPAIPAMAVLAGCAVAAVAGGLRSGQGRPLVVVATSVVLVAIVGRIDPQPAYRRDQLLLNAAVAELGVGNWGAAERNARDALAIDPQSLNALAVLMDAARMSGSPATARPFAQQLIVAQPWNPNFKVQLARIDLAGGRRQEALTSMDRIVAQFPWSADLRMRRAELRADAGDLRGADEDARWARDRGVDLEPWLAEKLRVR